MQRARLTAGALRRRKLQFQPLQFWPPRTCIGFPQDVTFEPFIFSLGDRLGLFPDSQQVLELLPGREVRLHVQRTLRLGEGQLKLRQQDAI